MQAHTLSVPFFSLSRKTLNIMPQNAGDKVALAIAIVLHGLAWMWFELQPNAVVLPEPGAIEVSLIENEVADEIMPATLPVEQKVATPREQVLPQINKPSPLQATQQTTAEAQSNSPQPSPVARPQESNNQSLSEQVNAPVSPPRHDVSYLNNPKPVYPLLSKRAGEEGLVLLRVLVSTDGLAEKVEINKSSGFSRLDEAARKTVLKWQFKPAQRGNTPIADWVQVPVNFNLNQE